MANKTIRYWVGICTQEPKTNPNALTHLATAWEDDVYPPNGGHPSGGTDPLGHIYRALLETLLILQDFHY